MVQAAPGEDSIGSGVCRRRSRRDIGVRVANQSVIPTKLDEEQHEQLPNEVMGSERAKGANTMMKTRWTLQTQARCGSNNASLNVARLRHPPFPDDDGFAHWSQLYDGPCSSSIFSKQAG